MTKPGLLLPIVAPSGTGKTTVCRALLRQDPDFVFSVSCTTRAPRANERHGIDYHFIDRETFAQYQREGRLAEWQEVFGDYYGTLRSAIESALSEGRILLLDIDVKGALRLKQLYPQQTICIFLMPPSLTVLNQRLQNRGTEDAPTVAKRQARVPEELQLSNQCDYRIINDQLPETVEQIMHIIEEYRNHD